MKSTPDVGVGFKPTPTQSAGAAVGAGFKPALSPPVGAAVGAGFKPALSPPVGAAVGAGFKPAPIGTSSCGRPGAVNDDWAPLEDLISRDLFKAEVKAWAQRIDVSPREVHLRPMRRKWGSCSTSGRLTFNEELLAAPPEIRRRVIVEELVHLKVPNHGKLFKALLKSYLEMD